MTESELKTPSHAYNAHTEKNQLIHEEYNSAYNHQHIIRYFQEGRACDLEDVPKQHGKPCIVIGSGPSLDEALPLLKDWKGGIICTTSHARTLYHYGIPPTHIVALDPFSEWTELEGVPWEETRTQLVANPGVWPDLIEHWPNDFYFYRQNMGNRDTFYAREQCHMYSWREGHREATFHFLIRTELAMFACSPPAQLFVADKLGYGTIFLCGVDFAFSHGKERFTEWIPQADGTWMADAKPIRKDTTTGADNTTLHDGPLVTNNGIETQQIHLYYKKNFITAVRLSLQSVYTTDHGAITELPYADIAEVIATQGAKAKYPRLKKDEIIRRTEPYLATVGCYVIHGKNGYVFAEMEDPRLEVPRFMAMMNRVYQCNECGSRVDLKDNRDHNGENCRICPTGKIHQASPVDIDQNMRRINSVLEMAGK